MPDFSSLRNTRGSRGGRRTQDELVDLDVLHRVSGGGFLVGLHRVKGEVSVSIAAYGVGAALRLTISSSPGVLSGMPLPLLYSSLFTTTAGSVA